LERLVAAQTVELSKLREECKDLSEAASTFAQVVELLRQAGLTAPPSSPVEKKPPQQQQQPKGGKTKKSKKVSDASEDFEDDDNEDEKVQIIRRPRGAPEYEYFDDAEIFGSAPSSVIDAADAAGAAILAAMLAGKLRMLVDVRDAELNTDPDMLVQFIELAILPVAAGLEGLTKEGNRVKVVFPTVNKLLEYRKAMALSAPEVVALSVLGFGSVEEKDNLVVFIAPSPDDEEGMAGLLEIIDPPNPMNKLRQPVVILNHHMLPLASGPFQDFEIVYHLRLLSVQYMTGDTAPECVDKIIASQRSGSNAGSDSEQKDAEETTKVSSSVPPQSLEPVSQSEGGGKKSEEDDAALEAAMTHAHEAGIHQGITRAMVIRAYPRSVAH